MNVELFGQCGNFEQLKPGAFFRFSGAANEPGRQHLALKVTSAEKRGRVARVLIDPGHPGWRGQPSVRPSPVGGADPVFHLNTATFRPSLKGEDWLLSADARYDAGDVLVADGHAFLVAGFGSHEQGETSLLLVDLLTGQFQTTVKVQAIVRVWSIVIPVDGQAVVLFQRKPPTAT